MAVGYYVLPVRVLLSAADAVAKFGMVTGVAARNYPSGDVGTVGMYVQQLLPDAVLSSDDRAPGVWYVVVPTLGRRVVRGESAPPLPVMALGITFGDAGQQNSTAIV